MRMSLVYQVFCHKSYHLNDEKEEKACTTLHNDPSDRSEVSLPGGKVRGLMSRNVSESAINFKLFKLFHLDQTGRLNEHH